MHSIIRLWMVFAFVMVATVWNMNLITDIKANHFLKEDMELAVHDATLAIDNNYMAQGKIVFDRTKAYDNFIKSLEKNARLTATTPNADSFFEDEFKVVTMDFIDDSNATFPYTYHHPIYHFDVLYSGPTIVVVIETYGPRFFKGEKNIIRRAASYTHKF